MGVRVAVAVGGRGVSVGIGEGSWPSWVKVGLAHAGGMVCVGNITGLEVTVGLNIAVIVKSGVGNPNGVGEGTNGKLHARDTNANKPTAWSGKRHFLFMLPSLLSISNTIIIDHLTSSLEITSRERRKTGEDKMLTRVIAEMFQKSLDKYVKIITHC